MLNAKCLQKREERIRDRVQGAVGVGHRSGDFVCGIGRVVSILSMMKGREGKGWLDVGSWLLVWLGDGSGFV